MLHNHSHIDYNYDVTFIIHVISFDNYIMNNIYRIIAMVVIHLFILRYTVISSPN